MKALNVVARLNDLTEMHGNLPVFLFDQNWQEIITINHQQAFLKWKEGFYLNLRHLDIR